MKMELPEDTQQCKTHVEELSRTARKQRMKEEAQDNVANSQFFSLSQKRDEASNSSKLDGTSSKANMIHFNNGSPSSTRMHEQSYAQERPRNIEF